MMSPYYYGNLMLMADSPAVKAAFTFIKGDLRQECDAGEIALCMRKRQIK